MTIRVVLGEDNVLVREGVRALLDSYEDIEVVGVAQDAPTLMAAAAEHVPDVVVTDIKMPPSFQLEGIDCAHAIRHDHPEEQDVLTCEPQRFPSQIAQGANEQAGARQKDQRQGDLRAD